MSYAPLETEEHTRLDGEEERGEDDLLRDSIQRSQHLQFGSQIDGPVDHIRRLNEQFPSEAPPIFSELLQLEGESWKQAFRWVKYEQAVEGEFSRFSKPRITMMHVQALLQLKNCFQNGVVLLDLPHLGFDAIAEQIVCRLSSHHNLSPAATDAVSSALLAPKMHIGSLATSPSISLKETKEEKDEKKKLKESLSKANLRLLSKLPPSTQAASLLVGPCSSIDRPVVAFVRLQTPQLLYPSLPDLPVPVRFIFVLLSPTENYENERITVGKTVGALMADEVFRKVALNCTDKKILAESVEEFISQVVAVPPGSASLNSRWEPRDDVTEVRSVGILDDEGVKRTNESEGAGHGGITRTGRLFGGLIQDIRTKSPHFLSDFSDFFRGRLSQSIAATIFLFFANITSIITFGAVMERTLDRQMASIESILCGGICGVLFALFSGQPLNILSATGPTLVFEKILYDFCLSNGWEFLPFRCCVGLWIVVFLIVLAATDMSSLVGLITRFTEEAFATLISVVFVIQAFQKLMEIGKDAPIVPDPTPVYDSPCLCYRDHFDDVTNSTISTVLRGLSGEACSLEGGELRGLQCHFHPDIYMMSILLTFATFAIAFYLNRMRQSALFGSKIRNAVSDFGVVIAIVSMTLLSHFVGLDVPSLHVPEKFQPTLDRSWLISLSSISLAEAAIALFPAAFYTILIVMDQQITAVIINRKDNMLKKGHGYHLDLVVIALLVLICSFLGLPFYVAATVLSVMHVDSLRIQSESAAPGEQPRSLGVKEQRMTALLAHLLIGLSVFLTGIIKLVPLPVLIGVFLYMGVVSLLGQQFVQRCMMFIMSVKHQPDYPWMRNVSMKKVHLFTAIQVMAVLALFFVKYMKPISMMFPLMLVFMVILRMFVLGRFFSTEELKALDDIPPTFKEVVRPNKHKYADMAEQDVLLEKGSPLKQRQLVQQL